MKLEFGSQIKIAIVSKKSTKELPNDETKDVEITTHKKWYISPEESQANY